MPRASIRFLLLFAFIAVTVLSWSLPTDADARLGDNQLFGDSGKYEVENEAADSDEEVNNLEDFNALFVHATTLFQSRESDACLDVDDQSRLTLRSLNAPRPPPVS